MDFFKCPICDKEHKTLIRYSNCVCNDCLYTYQTRDKLGNIKSFYNIDFSGGIKAVCKNEPTFDFSCYVNNIECKADEARFGGIVIIPKLIPEHSLKIE